MAALEQTKQEISTTTSLECCYGEHYDDPGTAYIHRWCGKLLRPWGDVHEHPVCNCFTPEEVKQYIDYRTA